MHIMNRLPGPEHFHMHALAFSYINGNGLVYHSFPGKTGYARISGIHNNSITFFIGNGYCVFSRFNYRLKQAPGLPEVRDLLSQRSYFSYITEDCHGTDYLFSLITHRDPVGQNYFIVQVLLLIKLGNTFIQNNMKAGVRDTVDRRPADHFICIQSRYIFGGLIEKSYNSPCINGNHAVIRGIQNGLHFAF